MTKKRMVAINAGYPQAQTGTAGFKLAQAAGKLGHIESGFDRAAHSRVFRDADKRLLESYLSTARIDLKNPKVFSTAPDEVLRMARLQFVIGMWKEQGIPHGELKGRTEAYKAAAFDAALQVLAEIHGKTLAEAWKIYEGKLREIDSYKTAPPKLGKEQTQANIIGAYLPIIAHAFNNTILNHWEKEHGRTLAEHERRRVLEYFTEKIRCENLEASPLLFIGHVNSVIKEIDEETARRVTREHAEQERIAETKQKAGSLLDCFILGSDRAELEKQANAKAETGRESGEVLAWVEETALKRHNRQLKKLAAQERYAQLNVWADVHRIKDATAREQLMFALVHSMAENRPADDINALLQAALEKIVPKKKETAVSPTIEPKREVPKRDFSKILTGRKITKDEERRVNRYLNKIHEWLGRYVFDTQFLPSLQEKLSAGLSIIDAIRLTRNEFKEKPQVEGAPQPVARAQEPEVVENQEAVAPQQWTITKLLKEIESAESVDPLHLNLLKKSSAIIGATEEQKIAAAEHVILRFMAAGSRINLHEEAFRTHIPSHLKQYGNSARDNLIAKGHITADESKPGIWKIVPSMRSKYGRR